MRLAARTDANQKEIVEALRAAYCSVVHLHAVGKGCPDIAVGYQGHTYFMEIKTDSGKLTPSEQRFMDEWRGHYAIVRTPDEALKAIGVME